MNMKIENSDERNDVLTLHRNLELNVTDGKNQNPLCGHLPS